MQRKKKGQTFIKWFIASGITVILIGCFLAYQQLRFINQSASSDGTIVELKAYKSQRRSTSSVSYCPIAQFTTVTGELIRFEGSICSYPPSFQAEQKVPILYNPNNPKRAEISTFWQLWFNSVLVIGLGVLFTGISWLCYRFM